MGEAMEHLLSFLNLSNEAIVAEALVSIKDVLRKYPDVENVLPALRDALKTVTEEKAKVAVISCWVHMGTTFRTRRIFGEHHT
eukprot:UN16214